jgi:hypothetical protein
MADETALRRFIRSAFGSVWSLELLLLVRQKSAHRWTHDELIDALRASEQVLRTSTADLVTAGLVTIDAEGRLGYAATAELDATVAAVAALYGSRPGAVRRMIVGGGADPAISFADAFRFRKGQGE